MSVTSSRYFFTGSDFISVLLRVVSLCQRCVRGVSIDSMAAAKRLSASGAVESKSFCVRLSPSTTSFVVKKALRGKTRSAISCQWDSHVERAATAASCRFKMLLTSSIGTHSRVLR
jgi:hypothetical protein